MNLYKRLILVLGILIISLCSKAQGKPLFEKVPIESDLYGYWIAPWSINIKGTENKILQYSVYHFKENDSLYVINNERISSIRPVRFYNRNDTIHISFYGNEIIHLNRLKSSLSMISVRQDSFILSHIFNDKVEVFHKSKSKNIPYENYPNYLRGREFENIGWIACGINSFYTIINYKFETDSTYTKTITKMTRMQNQKVYHKEIISSDNFSFTIKEDKLFMESDNRKLTYYKMSPRKIKQRIGIKENELIISGMDEIK